MEKADYSGGYIYSLMFTIFPNAEVIELKGVIWCDLKWTLLTVFTFKFESWSSRLWKGALHFQRACGVRPITKHCASWPIRADFVENEAFERDGAKIIFFEH